MTSFSSKLLLLLPASLLLFGCVYNPFSTQTQKQPINLPTITNSSQTTQEESQTNTISSTIDTSDWLTYENEEYGFSFRYPSDWNLEEVTDPGQDTDVEDVLVTQKDCVMHFSRMKISSFVAASELGNIGNMEISKSTVNGILVYSYNDVVNDQHEEGTIYHFMLNNNAFSALLRFGTKNTNCVDTSNKIMRTLLKNS